MKYRESGIFESIIGDNGVGLCIFSKYYSFRLNLESYRLAPAAEHLQRSRSLRISDWMRTSPMAAPQGGIRADLDIPLPPMFMTSNSFSSVRVDMNFGSI